LLAAAATALAAPARADVKLSGIFGDGMVLQRESEVAVWGTAKPGATIEVAPSWGGTNSGIADAKGRFRVLVRTPPAGGPFEVAVRGDGELTLHDVMSGDVWLCSGQSNMEWHIVTGFKEPPGAPTAQEEIAAANFPEIRLFAVHNRVSTYECDDVQGAWKVCSPETAGDFSATAYYFGRKVHQELGVPIGLITSDWGGTPARAWTSSKALRAFPQFGETLDYLAIASDPNKRVQFAKEHGGSWWDRIDDRGSDPVGSKWSALDYDDSSWKSVQLPASLEQDGLDHFDGIVYFRRAIEIPKEWEGHAAILELGPIDDRDDTWLDGALVGETRDDGKWNVPRVYAIDAKNVRAGKHVLAVRMLDTGGIAGINGKPEQMLLRSENASAAPISLSGEWKLRRGPTLDELQPMSAGFDIGPGSPTTLFNGMIAPLAPLKLRGVLWYQGEADVGDAATYRALFPALIRDWRERFDDTDLPFYFVEIAPFGYTDQAPDAAAELRDAQRLALALPYTGMAITMDIGDPDDIHPGRKQLVGARLAYWALAKTYGRPCVSYCGPLYRSSKTEGGSMRVRFDHADGGLVAKGGALEQFTVAGADKRFFPAEAAIDGDCVVVSSPRVGKPVAVRYGWTNAAMPNLFNAAGLPASSFRTDDWAGATLAAQ
jgi:sialate O-acetylesterase